MAAMEAADRMICGGCAAKLGPDALARALERLELPEDSGPVVLGTSAAEDVVAHALAEDRIDVSNLDAFRAFGDDPYLVGRVAAVNSVSDLLAKGVQPRFAQALVAVPDHLDERQREEHLFQTLSGARAAFDEFDVRLLGGHTMTAPEALVGFHVEGSCGREDLLVKAGARPGDALVLTKALGTGVVLFADMRGRSRGPWLAAAQASMVASNQVAAMAALELGAHASTDVTGFGLAGHLADLLRASSCGARIELSRLPALPGAVELLGRGERSTFHPENRKGLRALEIEDEARGHAKLELLFDPQTSGGLLLALPGPQAAELVARVESAGLAASIIGEVVESSPPAAFTVVV
jgi:selenide,water dikinase